MTLEYGLGFGFGWTIFQSLFMRGMAGGSYWVALKRAFMPEFLSMNLVMTGMILVASLFSAAVGGKQGPLTPTFWFVMSMALLAGFVVAFPINWWLVAKGLKHGMSTVGAQPPERGAGKAAMTHPAPAAHPDASTREVALMAALSVIAFGLAYTVAGDVRASMQMRPMASVEQPGSFTPHG